jgi:membrane protease YdiL (CAAX protease family)
MTEPLATPSFPTPPACAPPRVTGVEVCVVFGATVGLSLAGSLWDGSAAQAASAFTDGHLLGLVAVEVLLAALLIPWLRRRGWSPRDVAGAPGPADLARGVGLWGLALTCSAATWLIFSLSQPEAAQALADEQRFTGAPPSAVAVILVSVVNPVFEEFLWLGYGVTRLVPRLGLRAAAAVSIGLRVIDHVYQGPWAVLGILPLGVAFTWYFGRTRRLWPVVVAHALFDAVGLVVRMSTQ